MRLISVDTYQLKEFNGEVGHGIPPYGILSHTWGDEEVSFQDLTSDDSERARKKREGYAKIVGCCTLAKADGLEWAWLDTCCIDKTNSTELIEAINSMFQWYAQSEVCYAYLSDVHLADNVSFFVPKASTTLGQSRWFTRGWTLQELLAPHEVIFVDSRWREFGSKRSLQNAIRSITGIDSDALTVMDESRSKKRKIGHGFSSSRSSQPPSYSSGQRTIWDNYSVAQKFSWAANRQTTRPEDEAYCLLGLFGVSMPLLYGEGRKAFMRLQEEILRRSTDQSIFAWSRPSIEGDHRKWTMSGLLATSPKFFQQATDADVAPRIVPAKTSPSTLQIPASSKPEGDDEPHVSSDKSETEDENQQNMMESLDFMHEVMQTWTDAYFNPFELIRNMAVLRQPMLGPLDGIYVESMPGDGKYRALGSLYVTAVRTTRNREIISSDGSTVPLPDTAVPRPKRRRTERGGTRQRQRPPSPVRYEYIEKPIEIDPPSITLTRASSHEEMPLDMLTTELLPSPKNTQPVDQERNIWSDRDLLSNGKPSTDNSEDDHPGGNEIGSDDDDDVIHLKYLYNIKSEDGEDSDNNDNIRKSNLVNGSSAKKCEEASNDRERQLDSISRRTRENQVPEGKWLWFTYQSIYVLPLLCAVNGKPTCILVSSPYVADDDQNSGAFEKRLRQKMQGQVLMRIHAPSLVYLDPSLIWMLRPQNSLHAFASRPEDESFETELHNQRQNKDKEERGELLEKAGPEIRIGSLLNLGYSVFIHNSYPGTLWVHDRPRKRILRRLPRSQTEIELEHTRKIPGFIFLPDEAHQTEYPAFYFQPSTFAPRVATFLTPEIGKRYALGPRTCSFDSLDSLETFQKARFRMLDVYSCSEILAPNGQAIQVHSRRTGSSKFLSLSLRANRNKI